MNRGVREPPLPAVSSRVLPLLSSHRADPRYLSSWSTAAVAKLTFVPSTCRSPIEPSSTSPPGSAEPNSAGPPNGSNAPSTAKPGSSRLTFATARRSSTCLRTVPRNWPSSGRCSYRSTSGGRRRALFASRRVYALGVKNPITLTKVPDGVVYVQVTSVVGSNAWMPRSSVSSFPPGPSGRRSITIRL